MRARASAPMRAAALLLCAAAGAAAAQDTNKIGYVDVVRLLEDSPQSTEARQRLQDEFEPRVEQLEAQRKELAGLEERLKSDGAVMSAERRDELERDIQRKRRDFAREREEVREEQAIRRNEELGRLQEKIGGVVERIARRDGFDLILTQAVVLHASKRIDITDRVLEAMDSP